MLHLFLFKPITHGYEESASFIVHGLTIKKAVHFNERLEKLNNFNMAFSLLYFFNDEGLLAIPTISCIVLTNIEMSKNADKLAERVADIESSNAPRLINKPPVIGSSLFILPLQGTSVVI
jgi:hypothetical protein